MGTRGRSHTPEACRQHRQESPQLQRRYVVLVNHNALRYTLGMEEKTMLNIRITEDEAHILRLYAAMTSQTQTGIIRAFIRSLEQWITRLDPETFHPYLLPSVPLAKHSLLPGVPAIYFLMTEDGTVLYVGRTTNLHTCFLTHHRPRDALMTDGMVRIHWLEKRLGQAPFAAACVKRFLPPLNMQGP
jgi:hypothetical protein